MERPLKLYNGTKGEQGETGNPNRGTQVLSTSADDYVVSVEKVKIVQFL